MDISAAERLNSSRPIVFPHILRELLVSGVQTLILDVDQLTESLDSRMLNEPEPEFGILGNNMAQYFDDYQFEEWMPGAWPIALDGAGGFYCLDLRGVLSGAEPNNGSAAVVWSHAGTLGWAIDEAAVVGKSLSEFLERTHAHPYSD